MPQNRELKKKTPKMGIGVLMLGLGLMAWMGVGSVAWSAGAWSTYRHDVTRSGLTHDVVKAPLSLRWVNYPAHAPKAAWPRPAEELPRLHVDSTYHVSIGQGMVFYGSSVDNKVYALDAKTGRERWSFFTEGPVRFAPTYHDQSENENEPDGRLYLGSDDGYVYCLAASDGRLIWKYRPSPTKERILGNGRMIAMWPIRSSILIDSGVAYFSAGVFPYEGLYLAALNIEDGSVIWLNDTYGDRASETTFGGMSPQGYLVASDDVLFVPSGRATPALFERATGRFIRFTDAGGRAGGSWTMVADGELIVGVDQVGSPVKIAYDAETGKKKGPAFGWYPGIDLVLTPDFTYSMNEKGIFAIDRVHYGAITEEIKKINDERTELRRKIRDLRTKMAEGSDTDKAGVETKMDEAAARIVELSARYEELRASMLKWKNEREGLVAIIVAGDLIYSGGQDRVAAIDALAGEEIWSAPVEGKAYGLAAIEGNLFVSTDAGPIYCFSQGEIGKAVEIHAERNPNPYPEDAMSARYRAAADKIVADSRMNKGYALVLGAGEGRLAHELALRTDLKIVGIEHDEAKRATARQRLDSAGLYGSRVIVEDWDLSTLPNFFANLIVSDEVMASGKINEAPEDVSALLRPVGGIAYLGQPDGAGTAKLDAEALRLWMRAGGFDAPEIATADGVWGISKRGALEGSGSWTSLYGNPQNTASSTDDLEGPLGVLWYGEPGAEGMVDRHGRAAGPISINGLMFVQGANFVRCYDAYNGTFLWERRIPGAVRVRVDVDGGNLSATDVAVFVAAHDKCYNLDPATGETVMEYALPASTEGIPHRWGYVQAQGDLLLGSTALPLNSEYAAFWNLFADGDRWKSLDEIPESISAEWSGNSRMKGYLESFFEKYPKPSRAAWMDMHRRGMLWRFIGQFASWGSERTPEGSESGSMMESDSFFAVDSKTGEMLWQYKGDQLAHITTVVGDGVLFLTDANVTDDQRAAARKAREEQIASGVYVEGAEKDVAPEDADVRLIVALDMKTGQKLWERPMDLTGCGAKKMGAAYQNGLLVFLGHFSDHDGTLFKRNQLAWRRITALKADSGAVKWSKPLNYLRRPVIIGDRIVIEPLICELQTGNIVNRAHPITDAKVPLEFLRPGHSCGVTSASKNMIFYRSYSAAIYDLKRDAGLELFGGLRPGCWINLIAANGLLMYPEASSGCTCSFPLRTTVVMANKARQKKSPDWSIFITRDSDRPAERFAVNFGAPGDMRDDDGIMWFGYPRTTAWYGVKFNMEEKVIDGLGYFARDFTGVQIEGSDRPWLFTTGVLGLLECEVPLKAGQADQRPGVYTVRLGFSARPGDGVGNRVFDVKLQGKTVLENFDIVAEAGEPNKALIKEITGIEVVGNLKLELVPQSPNPDPSQAPILNFIEALNEDAGKITQAFGASGQ